VDEDGLPNVWRAVEELRAEYRDIEVLRLRKQIQVLHGENRELARRLALAERGRDEYGRTAA
jgi:hypothetical protein